MELPIPGGAGSFSSTLETLATSVSFDLAPQNSLPLLIFCAVSNHELLATGIQAKLALAL